MIASNLFEYRSCNKCSSLLLWRESNLQSPPSYPNGYHPVFCTHDNLLRRTMKSLLKCLFYTPLANAQAKILMSMGTIKAGSSVLDLGCGSGAFVDSLRRLDVLAQGLEPHPGSSLAPQTIKVGTAENCSSYYSPASFDAVTAIHLLEHLSSPRSAIREAFQLLKPGGFLVLGSPLSESWHLRIFGKRSIFVTEAPRHISVPTIDGLKMMAEGEGFLLESIKADCLLNRAAITALTLFPESAAFFSKESFVRYSLFQLLGIMSLLLVLPILFFEPFILKRPCSAFLFFRKNEK